MDPRLETVALEEDLAASVPGAPHAGDLPRVERLDESIAGDAGLRLGLFDAQEQGLVDGARLGYGGQDGLEDEFLDAFLEPHARTSTAASSRFTATNSLVVVSRLRFPIARTARRVVSKGKPASWASFVTVQSRF